MIFIGWNGRARNGKTRCMEAVQEYAEAMHRTVGIYDIGDMIRRQAIAKGRLPLVERKDMTPEQIQVLIDLGKEMREIDSNYWVKAVLKRARLDDPGLAMCPNIRLPQEAEAIRKDGGVLVRVTRLNADGSQFISRDRDPNDITETALDRWDSDFYLVHKTAKDDRLIRMQAMTLYRYIYHLKNRATPVEDLNE